MLDLEKMRVSLTKNGYIKVADVVRRHRRNEILENIRGSYRGINLERSQVSKILSVDADSGEVPEIWDEIKEHGDEAIDAFTFVAIILTHVELISVLAKGHTILYRGVVSRSDLSDKAYTNLVFAMTSLNLCDYEKGATETHYDFHPLVANLQGDTGRVVRNLVALKLKRCGWVDPDTSPSSGDHNFAAQCEDLRLPEVFGMSTVQFQAWLQGDLQIEIPDQVFGLNRDLRRPRPR